MPKEQIAGVKKPDMVTWHKKGGKVKEKKKLDNHFQQRTDKGKQKGVVVTRFKIKLLHATAVR